MCKNVKRWRDNKSFPSLNHFYINAHMNSYSNRPHGPPPNISVHLILYRSILHFLNETALAFAIYFVLFQARLRSRQRYCDSRLYTKMCSPKHQYCRHVRQRGSVPKGSQIAEKNNRLERDQWWWTVPVSQHRSGNIFIFRFHSIF